MKSNFLLVIVLSLISTGLLFSQENSKIAVVDIQLVFNTYIQTIKPLAELKKIRQQYQDEITVEENKINELEKRFEAKKLTLSDQDFKRILAIIELKKEKLNTLVNKRNLQLKKMEIKLRRPILKKIRLTIEKIRKEKGYLIILNKADVVAYSPKIDITKEIIRALGIAKK